MAQIDRPHGKEPTKGTLSEASSFKAQKTLLSRQHFYVFLPVGISYGRMNSQPYSAAVPSPLLGPEEVGPLKKKHTKFIKV